MWHPTDTSIVRPHVFSQTCPERALKRRFQTHTNTNKWPKSFKKYVCIWLDLSYSLSLSVSVSPPSLSPHLFVLIITKPCHHGSRGHVNQPGRHHLFPAVYLQPNKGVCLFVVAGVECCVGRGLLFNSGRCYQPPLWKGQFNTENQWIWGKEGRCQCGGCRTLRN